MTHYAHIVGWGKYVPPRVLTNDDISRLVDTSDEWVYTRTGIRERRQAAEGEATAYMAIQAAQDALEVARVNPDDLGLIIVATVTPDYPLPSTACLVQDALGAKDATAFDLAAGCTGFVYALSVASQLLAAGAYETALVIGSETLSRVTDWTDRTTCVLFGDGAGAVVLQAGENEGGVLTTTLGSDGSGWDLLQIPGGGSRRPASTKTVAERSHFIKMSGRPVFRFAVKTIPAVTREVLKKGDLDIAELSLLIPHQANQRIIEAAVRGLGIAPEMAYTNLERYGNTSGASIPIALCEAVEEDRVQPGDLVVLVGFGAGLTWGAAAVRWTQPRPVPLTRWQRISRRLLYLVATVRSRVRRARRWLGALFTESILNGKGGEEE